jgi:hypothetical protein
MPNTNCFESEVKPLKCGYNYDDKNDCTSGVAWAVFDRKEAETEVGWKVESGDMEFAENLTGLHASNNGPGRSFSCAPTVKVYGKKILILQRTGLDI